MGFKKRTVITCPACGHGAQSGKGTGRVRSPVERGGRQTGGPTGKPFTGPEWLGKASLVRGEVQGCTGQEEGVER